MLTHARTLALSVCFLIATKAQAQLGPTPSEIPVQQPISQPAQQPAQQPSESARARPAIDELLGAKARGNTQAVQDSQVAAQTRTASQPSSQLREELLASEPTLPATSLQQGARPAEEALTGTSSLPSLGDGWGQTIIALGGVLLLIFGVAQFYKKLANSKGGLVGQIGAGGSAPSGILEVIGRYPVATGMTLVVLKFDRRVLLVASGAATRGKHAKGASMQTLCELTDPEDVASILLKARSASGESIAHSFERALQDADDFTDESIYRQDEPLRSPRSTQRRTPPARTITSDEGDRAELWSGQGDGLAAAKVLRQRLASMRQGNHAG